MRVLAALNVRLGHLFQTHPWLRLFLGAGLVVAGVLSLLVGVGHGGLIAAGSIVLAGAIAAIRGNTARDADTHLSNEPFADAEDPGP
jgi:hypothetical protein